MTVPLLRNIVTPLPLLPAGWHLVSMNSLTDGRLGLLAADVDLPQVWLSRADGNPREIASQAQARIWTFDGDELIEGPTFPLEIPLVQFDQFSDGRWLIVAPRTVSDPNGRVIAADGSLVGRLMLGDGIWHIGIDQSDRIWVGWFDEGIFGNAEWPMPNGQWPPSSNGIGVFMAGGADYLLPKFPADLGSIGDCYSLNIDGDSGWACTFSEFPILELAPDRTIRWWTNEIAGAQALAISGRYALLAGGYGSDADRLALVALDGDGDGSKARPVRTWRLPLRPRRLTQGVGSNIAESNNWYTPTLLTGRGDTIHLIEGDVWYRWKVSDAVSDALGATT